LALKSQSLYLNAENILMEELGCTRVAVSQPKPWYITPTQTGRVNRLDAEYFHPRYERLLSCIQRFSCLTLGEVTRTLKNGKTPAAEEYSEQGAPVLKVDGLRSTGVIEQCGAFVPTSWAEKNAKGKVMRYDALMICAAHHQRYIGKTGLLMEDLGPLARAAGELIILRFKNSVRPEFVSVLLNLEPFRLLVQRLARGNTAHLYPKDLSAIPIPLLPMLLQEKVAHLLTQSYRARRDARALFREATAKFEPAIHHNG